METDNQEKPNDPMVFDQTGTEVQVLQQTVDSLRPNDPMVFDQTGTEVQVLQQTVDSLREANQLKVENTYLKRILDNFHKNINLRESTSHNELKLPDDVENSQSLTELATNLEKVTHRFYELEKDFDYIDSRISKLSTVILLGEGSDTTSSPERTNIFIDMGHKSSSNAVAEPNKQLERSLKVDKELERITSACREIKDRKDYLDSLIKNLRDHIVHAAESTPEVIKHPDAIIRDSSVGERQQDVQYIYKMFLEIKRENKHFAEKNLCLEKILAALDSYCTRKKQTRYIVFDTKDEVEFASRFGSELGKAQQIARRFEEMKEELSALQNEMKKKTQEHDLSLKALKTSQEKLQTVNKDLAESLHKANRKKTELEDKSSMMQSTFSKLMQENQHKIENKNQEITKLIHEKEGLLIRLSKIAGDRLTHDNVNIADLSDADRPTKLSETYSELYDNEWTDAFEELTDNIDLAEEAAITYLLNILLNAFSKCKEITWDRYESLKLVASTIDVKQEHNSSVIEKSSGTVESDGMTTGQHEDQNKAVGATSSSRATSVSPGTVESYKMTTGQQEDQHKAVGATSSSPATSMSPGTLESDQITTSQQEDQHNGVRATSSSPATFVSLGTVESDGMTTGQQDDHNKAVGTTLPGPATSESLGTVESDGMTTGQQDDYNKAVGTTLPGPATSETPGTVESDEMTMGQQEDHTKAVGATSSSPATSEAPDRDNSVVPCTGQNEYRNTGVGITSSKSITLEMCMNSSSLTSTLSIDQEKSLKNIWRATSMNLKKESLKFLYENLIRSLGKPETEMPNTYKYLKCCTELCWKMGMQEKPMYLDVNAEKDIGQEKQFDTDKFKAYTKTGKRAAYVVWPALFLHEGGAMLAKGIAQGRQK